MRTTYGAELFDTILPDLSDILLNPAEFGTLPDPFTTQIFLGSDQGVMQVTFPEPTSVPEPSVFLLTVIGLIGLACLATMGIRYAMRGVTVSGSGRGLDWHCAQTQCIT